MKELVILSGKGGAGKTSVTAAFAALAGRCVLADCDVDAADLHLLMRPEVGRRETFVGGREAVIREADCAGCGRCLEHCRFEALRSVRGANGGRVCRVDAAGCEGCGVCVEVCPAGAIDFPQRVSGEWFVSGTRFGPMVHARLIPGGENSGKLVSLVREGAREAARREGLELVIIDGPPGIGCPVIATLSGASRLLAVTEPTLSGLHDVERVLELARHFGVPALVCVNKWDINPEMTLRIEAASRSWGAVVAGRVRYDGSMTKAQRQGRPVTELPGAPAVTDLQEVWARVREGW